MQVSSRIIAATAIIVVIVGRNTAGRLNHNTASSMTTCGNSTLDEARTQRDKIIAPVGNDPPREFPQEEELGR